MPIQKKTRRRHKTEYLDNANFLMVEPSKFYNADESLNQRHAETSKLEFWNAKEPVRRALQSSYFNQQNDNNQKSGNEIPAIFHKLPNQSNRNSRFAAVQHIFTLPLEVDIDFRIEIEGDEADFIPSYENFEEKSRNLEENFDNSFSNAFPGIENGELSNFAKFAFSSLIGGIGYFEGRWLKANPERTFTHVEGPNELITAVPCRSMFPRGFLWDEGFHLLPIIRFNPDIAKSVVQSWFNLMDKKGWIAREQILGSEARSRVMSVFWIQHHLNY